MRALCSDQQVGPVPLCAACRLWKKLDNLSESDPEGYQKFLKDQAEAAKADSASKQDARVEGADPGVIVTTRLADVVPVELATIQIWAAKEGEPCDAVPGALLLLSAVKRPPPPAREPQRCLQHMRWLAALLDCHGAHSRASVARR